MARWKYDLKIRGLLLDNIYGLITMEQVAERTNYSIPRIGQFSKEMVVASGYWHAKHHEHPWLVSGYVYRQDRRNWAEANTPQHFYETERGLTEFYGPRHY